MLLLPQLPRLLLACLAAILPAPLIKPFSADDANARSALRYRCSFRIRWLVIDQVVHVASVNGRPTIGEDEASASGAATHLNDLFEARISQICIRENVRSLHQKKSQVACFIRVSVAVAQCPLRVCLGL